jgi:transketolase
MTTPVATARDLDQLAVNTIRFLAVDAVEKANSGHPGMPMGMADVAFVLWTKFMRYQPHDPAWPDRDRFVLSAGHGSMLLYAMLHLTGYDLPMDELQRFRQLGSRTPGHPEYGHTVGVETTTGPLGQGFGNGVGLALAARMLRARFDATDFSPVSWRVFGIVSDGDLMEGVSSEAASLAGHWGLGNLVYVYDRNSITIEGSTELAFTENVGARFEAYDWHVQHIDAHDRGEVTHALEAAVAETQRPSLIVATSHIAYGAPHKQDTREAHGEPLGADEVKAAKRALGWPESPTFLVPDEVRGLFRARADAVRAEYEGWQREFRAWRQRYPAQAQLWDAHVERRVPDDILAQLVAAAPRGAGATRAHGHAVLQRAAHAVPALVGGAADLEPSTKTKIDDSDSIARDTFLGRNLHFGIREHAMVAICNGLALSGGFIPYGSSFLVFTDYCRPSLRLSALMGIQAIWVLTHDSVFLGEDGPTHEPIEQLTSLRAMPNMLVIRPADGVETAGAWGIALARRDGPTLLALTRQNLPALERGPEFDPAWLARGGYVLRDVGNPAGVLIATGSEVSLAIQAADLLAGHGTALRVVSMPAPQRFLEQERSWREQVLPRGIRRISVEAAATWGWREIVGDDGLAIGIDRFGASAPLAQVQQAFGFTPEAVAGRIRDWLAGS